MTRSTIPCSLPFSNHPLSVSLSLQTTLLVLVLVLALVLMGSMIVYLIGTEPRRVACPDTVPFITPNTVVRLRRKHKEVRGRYRREG